MGALITGWRVGQFKGCCENGADAVYIGAQKFSAPNLCG